MCGRKGAPCGEKTALRRAHQHSECSSVSTHKISRSSVNRTVLCNYNIKANLNCQMYLEPVEQVEERPLSKLKSCERTTALTRELIAKLTLCGIDAYKH